MRLRFLALGSFLVFSGSIFSQVNTEPVSDSTQAVIQSKPLESRFIETNQVSVNRKDIKALVLYTLVPYGGSFLLIENTEIVKQVNEGKYTKVVYKDPEGKDTFGFIKTEKLSSANRIIENEIGTNGEILSYYLIAAKDLKELLTYDEAIIGCRDYSELSGGKDKGKWILPNRVTLSKISVLFEKERLISTTFASSFVAGNYWSYSVDENDSTLAWYKSFNIDFSYYGYKTNKNSVRCVRAL